ncbi:MAG: murein L,D-transpeptidase [Actinobacteria bacterium]|nr:MAG: murein L,D-transpeptidase [Actinomycetota bacterium]
MLVLASLVGACGPGDSTKASSPAPAAAPAPTTVPSSTIDGSTSTTTTRTFIAPSTSSPSTVPTTTLPAVKETTFLVQPGDENLFVVQIQARLKADGYDPGPIDGQYGPAVQAAVRAFQRVNDLAGDGVVGPLTMAAFDHPKKVEPMRPEGPPDRVEVSISRKLLVLYKGGAPAIITHVSSGSQIPFCENGVCGDAVTPIGDFTAIMKIDGWENGPLGAMYNSVYFWPAYAIHGSPNVPDVGASHGCVRIPMHIAEYFPSMIKYGEPIYIMA